MDQEQLCEHNKTCLIDYFGNEPAASSDLDLAECMRNWSLRTRASAVFYLLLPRLPRLLSHMNNINSGWAELKKYSLTQSF